MNAEPITYHIQPGRTVKIRNQPYTLKAPLSVTRLDWLGAYAGTYMSAILPTNETLNVVGPPPIDVEDIKFTEDMLLGSIAVRHSELAKTGKPSKAQQE